MHCRKSSGFLKLSGFQTLTRWVENTLWWRFPLQNRKNSGWTSDYGVFRLVGAEIRRRFLEDPAEEMEVNGWLDVNVSFHRSAW